MWKGQTCRADPVAGMLSSVHDKCMAVKTITIDIEAYELLRRRKQANQSFSQVIKAHFNAGEARTAARLLRNLPRLHVSADFLEAVEAAIAERGLSVPEPAALVGDTTGPGTSESQ